MWPTLGSAYTANSITGLPRHVQVHYGSYRQPLADLGSSVQAGDYNRVLTAQFTEGENPRPRSRTRQATTIADAAGRAAARLCDACDLKQQRIVQDLAAFVPKSEVWHGTVISCG